MRIVVKSALVLACSLFAAGILNVQAGEKIKFYNPADKTILPPDTKTPQRNFEPSLSPSLFESDPGGRMQMPPMLPPSVPRTAPLKNKEDKLARDKDWIFATSKPDSASQDSNEADDATNAEKVLGIKDYLLTKPSKGDAVRSFVQENSSEKRENDKEDKDDDKDSDRKSRERREDAREKREERLQAPSLKSFTQGSSERISSFETKNTMKSVFTPREEERDEQTVQEEKQQMNDFKGFLRPRNGGGSTILFDTLNPDATGAKAGFDPIKRSTPGIGFGAIAENPFAPRQNFTAAPSTSKLPGFEQPTFNMPAPSASQGLGGESQGSKFQAKPAVLPFPKRPGSLF